MTQPGRADLHVHTRASDGALSPAEVVAAAARAGLAAIAIADHDTLAGIEEASRAAAGLAFPKVVPAVEINTDYGEIEAHVICYFPDLEDGLFRDFLAEQVRSRAERARVMIDRLSLLGIRVQWQRVLELAAGGSIGRPHIAAAMVERGYARDFRAAMEDWLIRGRPGYVPRRKLTPHEAVVEVLRAGGVPVLAHPGLAGGDDLIDALVPLGLAGIEAYHPSHSAQQQACYAALGRARGLVITGGSDFHGPGMAEGAAIGDVTVPVSAVEELVSRLPARRTGAVEKQFTF